MVDWLLYLPSISRPALRRQKHDFIQISFGYGVHQITRFESKKIFLRRDSQAMGLESAGVPSLPCLWRGGE